MRTKRITLVFFVTITSISSLFLMGQVQYQINTPHLSVSSSSPPPLIAKEEEVNQFFDNYAALYKQKDIDAFLSLFSSKAVQNHKDGITEIRRIYSDFFKQSDELRYRMKGKMEIYQNAVEVKARYEIDQLNKRGQRKVWTGSINWVLTREDGVLKIISVDYQPEKSQ
jgi:ketosteroid isomerase-like protein